METNSEQAEKTVNAGKVQLVLCYAVKQSFRYQGDFFIIQHNAAQVRCSNTSCYKYQHYVLHRKLNLQKKMIQEKK